MASWLFCCPCCSQTKTTVEPFTTLQNDHYITLHNGPKRMLNVLHIAASHASSRRNSLRMLSQNGNSPPLAYIEPVAVKTPLSPDSAKTQDYIVKTAVSSLEIPSTSTSDDTELSVLSRSVPNKFTVTVDMEKTRSLDSRGSKLSLPPIITPPATPSTPTPRTADSAKSSTSAHRRVQWKLAATRKSVKRRNSVTPVSSKKRTLEIPVGEIEKIESLPAESLSASPPISEHSSYSNRPKSAKSTFGEIYSLGSPGENRNNMVFFIHGVGGNIQVWKHQIQLLHEKGFEVVALDLIGHGGSERMSKASDYHFKQIKSDVLAVFDRFSREKSIIVAHSYGTCFGVVLARERAEKVSHLILVSSGAPTPLAPDLGPLALPVCFLAIFTSLIRANFAKNAFVIRPSKAVLQEAFGSRVSVLKNMIKGQDWPEGDVSYHVWIRAQTLLIFGCKDGYVNLEEMQTMRRAIPDCHLEVVEDASHMVMMESPKQVNDLILSFIQLPAKTDEDAVNGRKNSYRIASASRPQSAMSRVLPHIKIIP